MTPAATPSRWALRVQTLRSPWRLKYALRRRAMLAAYAALAPRVAKSRATERIGSEYGGWTIPAGSIGAGDVAYCAGAGVDVTFDLGLADHGAHVVTIDPTDESRDHVAPHAVRLDFVHAALWSSDGEVDMFVAADPTHRTLSADDLQSTGRSLRMPCRELTSLMRERRHGELHLLKLDVEGAEYELIPSILAARPRTLCVEWHPTRPLPEMVRAYKRLLESGYRLASRQGADHTFTLSP